MRGRTGSRKKPKSKRAITAREVRLREGEEKVREIARDYYSQVQITTSWLSGTSPDVDFVKKIVERTREEGLGAREGIRIECSPNKVFERRCPNGYFSTC